MINTVIFDLDGTLLNTLDDLTDSLNFALSEMNLPCHSIEEVRHFVGNGIRVMIERAVPDKNDTDTVDCCFDIFCSHYAEHMEDKTRPYDGITDLLGELKARGFKTAIVSNKAEFATRQLCSKLFGESIDIAVGSNEKRRNKPYPDNVIYALEKLGSQKCESVFVGDSEVDIQTAKNAGLFAVGVLWGFRDRDTVEANGADYIVDRVEDLRAYLVSEEAGKSSQT
ncbi:MAG: HAD-IA family hydrolase [Clostridiales bacterium]|nr:HAD-IA family hydrolase [Clostridiales bacterium]